MTGEGFPILVDLVNIGEHVSWILGSTTKDLEGSVRALELADINGDGPFDLSMFDGVSSGLIDESAFRGRRFGHQTLLVGRILIFENPLGHILRRRLRRGEAELVAAGDIPYDTLVSSLDATRQRAPEKKEDKIGPGLLRDVARTARWPGRPPLCPTVFSRRQAN